MPTDFFSRNLQGLLRAKIPTAHYHTNIQKHKIEEYIMAEKEKNPFGGLKLAAQKGLASIDVEALKEKAAESIDAAALEDLFNEAFDQLQ